MVWMTPSPRAVSDLRQQLLAAVPPQNRNDVQFEVRTFGTRSAAKAFVAAWAVSR